MTVSNEMAKYHRTKTCVGHKCTGAVGEPGAAQPRHTHSHGVAREGGRRTPQRSLEGLSH